MRFLKYWLERLCKNWLKENFNFKINENFNINSFLGYKFLKLISCYFYTFNKVWPCGNIIYLHHMVNLTTIQIGTLSIWPCKNTIMWWHMALIGGDTWIIAFHGMMPCVITFWLSHWLIVNSTMEQVDHLGANQITQCGSQRWNLNVSFWLIVKLKTCQIWLVKDVTLGLVKKITQLC
jgi:hypothetical protein